MSRYIDAEALKGALSHFGIEDAIYRDEIELYIDNTPTADVVEVVRCEYCAVPHNKWTGCPHLNGLIPPPDFYCASGQRKEGE